MYHFNSINLDYLCSVISPETYLARKPQLYPIKTALSSSRNIYNLVTNTSGAVGMYVIPKGVVMPDSNGPPR